MSTLFLYRLKESDEGTEGILIYPEQGFECYTLELPDRGNQRNISRIPAGVYPTQLIVSGHFGRVYWVRNVPNRSSILIHSGNWGGDVAKGYKSHIQGCILVGQKMGWIQKQRAILFSAPARSEMLRALQEKDFTLDIREKLL